jgi:hypothetical protein
MLHFMHSCAAMDRHLERTQLTRTTAAAPVSREVDKLKMVLKVAALSALITGPPSA